MASEFDDARCRVFPFASAMRFWAASSMAVARSRSAGSVILRLYSRCWSSLGMGDRRMSDSGGG